MLYKTTEESDFKEKVSAGRWIVFHHMNGCLHCMLFRPAWNEAKSMCKNAAVNVAECEYADMANKLPATMRKVMGFPTIMVYENAKPKAAFNGPRTAQDVAEFMKSYAQATPKAAPKAKAKPAKKPAKK